MQPETALARVTIDEVFLRVYRELRPRSPAPEVKVQIRRYANATARILLEPGLLTIRLADTLEGAPEGVIQALAEILISKLHRRVPPAGSQERYRRYLNNHDVRRNLDLVRRIRGRKVLLTPKGKHYDLDRLFETINFRYFHGLMMKPRLGWSPGASRTLLGHYDASHNAIVLSRVLDRAETPRLVVEYVMFHEMLHLRFPAEYTGTRRRVHTREFKQAERQFADLDLAVALLKKLT